MVLNLEAEVGGALEGAVVLVLVEGEPQVVDARGVPVARLEHDVDSPRATSTSRSRKPISSSLPGRARFEPVRAFTAPAVAADEREAELAEIPRLEEPDLARHEVVVEQMQPP